MLRIIQKYKAADKNARHFIASRDVKRAFKWANIARRLLKKMVGGTAYSNIYNDKYAVGYEISLYSRMFRRSEENVSYILMIIPVYKQLYLGKINNFPSFSNVINRKCGHRVYRYKDIHSIPHISTLVSEYWWAK